MTEVLGYYEVITPAVAEPLTLADAKSFLRVEHAADNDLITSLISAVRKMAENITNKTLYTQTIKASFPHSESAGHIYLHKSPITAINSVKLYDAATDSFIVTTDYVYTPGESRAKIDFKEYIESNENKAFVIEIEFVVGNITEDMAQALKHHVNFLYENRGDVASIGSLKVPNESMFIYKLNRIIPGFG